jgi:pilus assembly protein CpaB
MQLAMKLPRFNRNWLMLGGAITLGVFATYLSHKVIQQHMAAIDAQAEHAKRMVSVVVPKQNMPRGAIIQPSMWAVRKIPASFAHSDYIDPDHFGEYVGKKLAAPLGAGEALLPVYLESTVAAFSSTLEDGNRALTTEVDEVNSISGMLRPSDHIDLMVTAHGSGATQTDSTFALLTNVTVLATGQVTHAGDGGGKQRTYTTITLSVSPTDAERIVVAKNSGRLTAVLRNPDDAQPSAVGAMSIDDVMPKKATSKGRSVGPVQYIVGGKG